MKLTILGSGGATPTPRPFCQCAVCVKARKLGGSYQRNSSSLFIENSKTVIDCGEDIANSLNRANIKQVNNLLITHWHPDHTFGFRHILESNYDFRTGKAQKQINLYVPRKVFEILLQKHPTIEYQLHTQKTAVLHLIEDGDVLDFEGTKITVVGYKGQESETYAYLIEADGKRVLYAPCDTISFDRYINYVGLDLLINECGLFISLAGEISFNELISRVKEIQPKKTILTHIEEIEINAMGPSYLRKIKKKYKSLNLDFAYDGMIINV